MKKNVIIIVMATIVAIVLFKWVNKEHQTPSGLFSTSSSSNILTNKPEVIKAYIDASGSMRGYFSKESDGRFIGSISNTHADTIVWLDTRLTKIKASINSSVLDGSYQGSDSKFNEMLHCITVDILTDTLGNINQNLGILFTDGIISSNSIETSIDPEHTTKSFIQLKNEIANSLEGKKLAVAIFKMDSKYVGTYWNYQNKPVNKVVIENRPFYAIALGCPLIVRHFVDNNKLGAASQALFGVYDQSENDKYLFAASVPQDFDAGKFIGKNVEFTASLPAYISKGFGKAYCQSNYKVLFNDEDATKSVTVRFNDKATSVTVSFDPTNPNTPLLTAENLMEFVITKQTASEWNDFACEDDKLIATDKFQQSKTFGLVHLLKGLQEGTETDDANLIHITIKFNN